MDVRIDWLPSLLPLVLGEASTLELQERIQALYDDPSISQDNAVSLEGWMALANELRVPQQYRRTLHELRDFIDALAMLSHQLNQQAKLAKRLGVERLTIGLRLRHGKKEAYLVGLHPDGRVMIEYVEKQPSKQRQRLSANPNSCFPLD